MDQEELKRWWVIIDINSSKKLKYKIIKKVEEKELQELQNLNSEFVSKKAQLGDLEIQKSLVLKQVESIRVDFGKLEQVLLEKYGENSVINLQTGEIKEKE